MANEDDIKLRGSGKEYKDDRGGATLLPSAVLGIVKNNIDPTRSGRIQVFLKRFDSTVTDDPNSWTTVRYLSPFYGTTPNTGNPQGYGDYVGNPHSYGFWATPPDINTEVVCVFLNGDPNEGYYIGSVPQPGLINMVPAIGASESIIPNEGEASSYGGATRLPVSEINNANIKQNNNPKLTEQPRPIHSYQAAIYNKQGLLRDPDRGPISSSAQRESPSRVFGMSTPGRPIYQGGYDDSTIDQAVTNTSNPDKNFQVIGRTGGHTLVMDDGDLSGKDQLMRFRTSNGHTILMSDSAQTLFIIHANGQSYIELGKEGTIDMYSTNSVNIRTQGDLNLHADRNINMFAAEKLNVNAKNIQIESEEATNLFAGTNFSQHVKNNYTNKVEGAMSLESKGQASLASSDTTFINGPSAVNLNTGSASLKPQVVKQVPKIMHTDTLYDSQVGFAAAPGKLESIVSRAPAHTPWADANKGTDVKTNLASDANLPEPASSTVEDANASASTIAPNPTTPALINTVPNLSPAGKNLNKNSTAALTSSMATNAANNITTSNITKQGIGVFQTDFSSKTVGLGLYALTPKQLEVTGHLKPGSSTAIQTAINEGKDVQEAIPNNAWTGKDGVTNVNGFINNKDSQTTAVTTLLGKSQGALIDKGIITGNENPTQTGGLVVATASAGIGPVTDYVKRTSGSTIQTNAQTSKIPKGLLNPSTGNVAGLIAAGSLAAGLMDKGMGGLSGASSSGINAVQGVVSGLFKSITSAFSKVKLKSGEPNNLQTANAEAQAPQNATNAITPPSPAQAAAASQTSKLVNSGASTLFNSTSGPIAQQLGKAFGVSAGVVKMATNIGGKLFKSSPSGVSMLPGGQDSVSTTVQGNETPNIPGTSSIKTTISSVTGSLSNPLNSTGGVVTGLGFKIAGAGSLNALAGTGLSSNDLGKLQGALNSISAGGPTEVKLPTTAEDTNDTSTLVSQSKTLLGNPKIPQIKV